MTLKSDTRGTVIINQTLHAAPDYTLQRVDEANHQSGISGSANGSADGRRIT